MADITDIISLGEHLNLIVRQATEAGFVLCQRGGVFDAAYPSSQFRRARVQGNGEVCGAITCNPNFYTWNVYDTD